MKAGSFYIWDFIISQSNRQSRVSKNQKENFGCETSQKRLIRRPNGSECNAAKQTLKDEGKKNGNEVPKPQCLDKLAHICNSQANIILN